MDPARYLALFVEEASEHLEEMEAALLRLEKEPASAEALEVCFRMAHSIKGMAAAMRFSPIVERAHSLEDRLSRIRSAGRVDPVTELPLLLAARDGIERMVFAVRDTGVCPTPPAPAPDATDAPGLKKKLRRTAAA